MNDLPFNEDMRDFLNFKERQRKNRERREKKARQQQQGKQPTGRNPQTYKSKEFLSDTEDEAQQPKHSHETEAGVTMADLQKLLPVGGDQSITEDLNVTTSDGSDVEAGHEEPQEKEETVAEEMPSEKEKTPEPPTQKKRKQDNEIFPLFKDILTGSACSTLETPTTFHRALSPMVTASLTETSTTCPQTTVATTVAPKATTAVASTARRQSPSATTVSPAIPPGVTATTRRRAPTTTAAPKASAEALTSSHQTTPHTEMGPEATAKTPTSRRQTMPSSVVVPRARPVTYEAPQPTSGTEDQMARILQEYNNI